MPSTSVDHRKRRRQQEEAFSHALREQKFLRIAWLATFRSFLTHAAANIPVVPEDEAKFHEIDKRLPQDGESRLNIVEAYLREKVPEFVRLFAPNQLVSLFLVGTVARCMNAKDMDPLSPWESRGRSRESGYFESREDFHRRTTKVIRELEASRQRTRQENVASLLGMDAGNFRRLCRRYNYHWSDLVSNARHHG